jgi:ribonuclease-3 family protein
MIDLGIEFTQKPNECNSLVLAFIGDTLYDLYVRSRLIADNVGMSAHKLHVAASKIVNAHGQSEAVKYIEDNLTEDELAAYKRGRNTKSYTTPKNAVVGEYRRATGFEALLGWLYTGGRQERLTEIMKVSYESVLNAQKQ